MLLCGLLRSEGRLEADHQRNAASLGSDALLTDVHLVSIEVSAVGPTDTLIQPEGTPWPHFDLQ